MDLQIFRFLNKDFGFKFAGKYLGKRLCMGFGLSSAAKIN